MKKSLLSAFGLIVIITLFAGVAQGQETPVANGGTVASNAGGWLDVLNCAQVGGWALDPDTPENGVYVELWSEVPGGLRWLATQYTTDERPDVNQALGITGNHGFNLLLPDSVNDGAQRVIHAYADDLQTGKQVELSGSPKSVTCGTKPAAITGTLDAPVKDAYASLFRYDGNGRTLEMGYVSVNNGAYTIVSDYYGDMLPDGEYDVWVSAWGYQDSRVRFSYTRQAGATLTHQMVRLPLTIKLWGNEGLIADGVLQATVKVCNNSFTQTYAQLGFLLMGPGKLTSWVETPGSSWLWTPAQGQCSLYTVSVGIDAGLPDGRRYCSQVKVGPFGEEPYSVTTACAYKGVQQ